MITRFIQHWRENLDALRWLHDRQIHGEPVKITVPAEVSFVGVKHGL